MLNKLESFWGRRKKKYKEAIHKINYEIFAERKSYGQSELTQ